MCDGQGRDGERFVWKGLWWIQWLLIAVYPFICLVAGFISYRSYFFAQTVNTMKNGKC